MLQDDMKSCLVCGNEANYIINMVKDNQKIKEYSCEKHKYKVLNMLSEENSETQKEICYQCKDELRGIYEVMIYDNSELKIVKCCSEECANNIKKANENELYDKYDIISRQIIQVIKRRISLNDK